jgi:hypothetical protein
MHYENRFLGTFQGHSERPKKRELVMTFKALRGMAPEYLTQMFHVSVNQTYQLRNNHQKLYLPKPKTIFLKRSFSYRGAVSWNQILMEKLPNNKKK